MARPKHVDIIDKLIDSFVKRMEIQGFMVSQELTYIGQKAIAKRLGVSKRTVARLLADEKLLHYKVYVGTRASIRTNETMIRMTFLAWHQACMDLRRKQQPCQTAVREDGAVMPDAMAR